VCVYACVCERVRESEWVCKSSARRCVCMCMCVCVCVCLCVGERE